MRWVVGVDHHGHTRGALALAHWLHEHSRSIAPQRLFAVHAIEDVSRPAPNEHEEAARVAAAEAATKVVIGEVANAAAFEAIHATIGPPDMSLERFADTLDADAISFDRVGRRDAGAIARLGTVARHLARALPRAITIVPPELRLCDIGTGPIVLASDLEQGSTRAAAFASRLARELSRELVVVYVDPPYRPLEFSELGLGLDDVAAWVRAEGLEPARARWVRGEVLDSVLDVAREERAPMLVVGARRLATGHRVFTSSVGIDLARIADRPVTIVPPR